MKLVRKHMDAPPIGVYAVYEDVLKRITEQPHEDRRLAKRALCYIYCARRPLILDELRHALAVEQNDNALDSTAIIDTDTLIDIAGGLVRVDQESGTLRLVHYTLQEYLKKNYGVLLQDPEAELAKACLTYLSFDVFGDGPCISEGALDRRLQIYPFLDYASHYWGQHVLGSQTQIELVVVAYLEDHQRISSFVQILHLGTRRRPGQWNRFPTKFGPLHVLAHWGLSHLLAFYLTKGVDINSQDSYGTTALQLAAKYGHEHLVELLVEYNAEKDMENKSGETALYWATRNRHKKIMMLLLEAGATVAIRDKDGWTALDWAVVNGESDMVKLLLEYAVDAEKDQRNDALWLAAQEGHDVTVQVLLDHGANVNGKDWVGSSALDWAAPGGHVKTVKLLLLHGCRVDLRDNQQNTALHWAIQYDVIVKMLLDHGADVKAENDSGQTPLCWTARNGPVGVARLLINFGSDVNRYDKHKCTALHGAALKGREEMVQVLLDSGADPNQKDEHGWTFLHMAAIQGHTDLVQSLVSRVCDGPTIVEWVALQKVDSRKRALLGYIAAQRAVGSTVLTGLRAAIQERYFTRMQMLLEQGEDPDATDVGGWTPLIVASAYGYTEAAQVLLDNGAEINKCGPRDWTALQCASDEGEEAAVQQLIKNGADLNAMRHGCAATLLAARKGHMAIVQSLLISGADANMEDYCGRRVLHWVARHGQERILRLLVRKGAKLNAVDAWGRTALMYAIESRKSATVDSLLNAGANIEVKCRDESTALHYAVLMQEKAIVRALLKRGAIIEAHTQDGFTALHVAAVLGCKEMVQLLLKNGANVNAKALWQGCMDRGEHDYDYDYEDEGLPGVVGVKSISERVSQLLFKEGLASKVGVKQVLTVQELGEKGGSIQVLNLLASAENAQRGSQKPTCASGHDFIATNASQRPTSPVALSM